MGIVENRIIQQTLFTPYILERELNFRPVSRILKKIEVYLERKGIRQDDIPLSGRIPRFAENMAGEFIELVILGGGSRKNVPGVLKSFYETVNSSLTCKKLWKAIMIDIESRGGQGKELISDLFSKSALLRLHVSHNNQHLQKHYANTSE